MISIIIVIVNHISFLAWARYLEPVVTDVGYVMWYYSDN